MRAMTFLLAIATALVLSAARRAPEPGEPPAMTFATIEVIVEPPFWRTRWFTTLVALAIVSLLWGGYLTRTRSIRRHNRALTAEIVERRRAEEELAANNAERAAIVPFA